MKRAFDGATGFFPSRTFSNRVSVSTVQNSMQRDVPDFGTKLSLNRQEKHAHLSDSRVLHFHSVSFPIVSVIFARLLSFRLHWLAFPSMNFSD